MNIFAAINAAITLFINYFWFTFPLAIYVALELNQYIEERTFITANLYRKYKAWRKKE